MAKDKVHYIMTPENKRIPSIPGKWVYNYHVHDSPLARNEHNDCCVRSFATVWQTDYEASHEHMRIQFQRKRRCGVAWKQVESAETKCPDTKMRRGPYSKDNKISLGQFCKAHPVGRYWVFVRGHALAVIDGVVYDSCYKPRRMVFLAYRVYGPKENTRV